MTVPVPLRHLTTLEDDLFFRPVVFLENGSIPRVVVLAADAATESMLLQCLLRAVCVVRCTFAFQKMSIMCSLDQVVTTSNDDDDDDDDGPEFCLSL